MNMVDGDEKLKELTDINQINYTFLYNCQEGMIENAKILYGMGADINGFKMYTNRNETFQYPIITCCARGQLDIAKWLSGLDVDIHVNNDEAFMTSCACGCLKQLNGFIHLMIK